MSASDTDLLKEKEDKPESKYLGIFLIWKALGL